MGSGIYYWSNLVGRWGVPGPPRPPWWLRHCLYWLLRNTERFAWTVEAEEALRNLKRLLINTPILVPPTKGEPLLLYVAATT
jgi:hypothetical protein